MKLFYKKLTFKNKIIFISVLFIIFYLVGLFINFLYTFSLKQKTQNLKNNTLIIYKNLTLLDRIIDKTISFVSLDNALETSFYLDSIEQKRKIVNNIYITIDSLTKKNKIKIFKNYNTDFNIFFDLSKKMILYKEIKDYVNFFNIKIRYDNKKTFLKQKIDSLSASLEKQFHNDIKDIAMLSTKNFLISVNFTITFFIFFIFLYITVNNSLSVLKKIIVNLKNLIKGETNFTTRIEKFSEDEFGELTDYFNILLDKLQNKFQIFFNKISILTIESESILIFNNKLIAKFDILTNTLGNLNISLTKFTEINNNFSNYIKTIKIDISDLINESEKQFLLLKSLLNKMDDITIALSDLSIFFENIKNNNIIINEIIKEVKEFTEKINILSLNASIEAVRNNKGNNGFMVIAKSIQDLSLKSANTVTEISSALGKNLIQLKNSNTTLQSIEDKIKNGKQIIQNTKTEIDNFKIKFDKLHENLDKIINIVDKKYTLTNQFEEDLIKTIQNFKSSFTDNQNIKNKTTNLIKIIEDLKGTIINFNIN